MMKLITSQTNSLYVQLYQKSARILLIVCLLASFSLEIALAVPNRDAYAAQKLRNIGWDYYKLQSYTQALEYYQQALQM